jgi:hypothetical protein
MAACWSMPNSNSSTGTLFSFSDTTGSVDTWLVLQNGTLWSIYAEDNTAATAIANSAVPAAGKWHFHIARFMGPSEFRLATLDHTGVITQGIDLVHTVNPASVDRVSVGIRTGAAEQWAFDGLIGEFYWGDIDPQPGGDLDEALVRYLAYNGPFSIPYIGYNLVDYKSLRNTLGSDQDRQGETFVGKYGPQTWVNNGATIGAHPPLPGSYNDGNTYRPVMIL